MIIVGPLQLKLFYYSILFYSILFYSILFYSHGKTVYLPPTHLCFSKRHRKGICRGQSHFWAQWDCCVCSMNLMHPDEVSGSDTYARAKEKGPEGAPGHIRLSF